MDTDSPPPLRASDPADPTRTDTRPAGTVLAIVVSTLALAALLNADSMLTRAETSELGTSRDVALAFWGPVERVSSTLGLTAPRSGLDAIRELDDTGSPSTKLIASGSRSTDGSIELAAPPDGTTDGDRSDNEQPADPGLGTLGHGLANESPDRTSDPGSSPGSNAELAPTSPLGPSIAPETDPRGPTTSAPAAANRPGGIGPGGTGIATAPTTPEGPTDPADEADDSTAPPTSIVDPVLLRRPTTDDPLRLLIIGDSTLDPVGAALLRDLGRTGVAAGVVDYRVSTGLSRPDFFDWPAHLRQLRPQLLPEVVIVMLGANDAQAFVVDNQAVEFGSEEWVSVYRSRVSALLEELTADGQWVIWIGQPAMRNDEFDDKMRQLNQLYAEEIGRFPTARFVDSRALTVDDGGQYAAYLLDGNGDRFQVRMTDGVHLTPAGGDRVAPSVIAIIDHIAPLEP